MDRIRVLYLTLEPKFLRCSTYYNPEWFEREFDIVNVNDDSSACRELKDNFFQVIISSGDREEVYRKFHSITNSPAYIRKKWIHYDGEVPSDSDIVGFDIMTCHENHSLKNPYVDTISVCTPLYHTKKEYFLRAYESLKKQTYNDWEWILIDDSKDKSKTEYIQDIISEDFRVKYYNFPHSGVIGDTKRKGFMLCSGNYLVELDHDDEITEDCLFLLKKTYDKYPEVGFVYSDCYQPEVNSHGNIIGSTNYGEGWGMDYGEDGILEEYKGHKIYRIVTPNQNCKTVRYITAMPNHVRSWRKSTYFDINGHNQMFFISDDYEIMVRTFLKTRMARIPKSLYVQYYHKSEDGENSQVSRIHEIQRTTYMVSRFYDKAIHERLLELGLEDYLWDEEQNQSVNIFQARPKVPEHSTIIVDLEDL